MSLSLSLCHTILPHNYRSRSSLLDVSSRTILLIVSARHRHKVILVVYHCLHFLTLLRLALSAVPSHDSDDHVRTLAPRVLLQPPPGLEQYAPPPGLAIDAPLVHFTHMAYLLKRHLCDPGYVQLSQSQPPACTIHMETHIMRAQLLPAREVQVLALAGTHNLVDTDPRAGTGPFPKPRALVLPLVHLGQSKPEGHGGIDTADSDLMHHQFSSFPPSIGIQARRAETLLTVSPLPVVSIMQFFFKKPVITSSTSLSSSLCSPAIRTLLSCSIKTPLSLTL